MEIEASSAASVPGGSDAYIFYAKTSQSHIIAKLFEALNANVNDINLWIGGTNMTAMCTDASQQRTTHLRLESKSFDVWHVQPGARVLVGINLPLLFKLVKDSIKDKNPLALFIKRDTQRFFVRVDKRRKGMSGSAGAGGAEEESVGGFDDSSVPILTLSPQMPQLPTAAYRTMISMDSHTFLQICKMCQHTSTERIRIFTDVAARTLTIQSEGTHNPADKRVTLAESDGDVVFRTVGPENFSSLFTLRLCHEIGKSTTLSDHMHLYLEPNQPLVFQFDAGNLGYLKFYLQSRSEE